MRRAFAAIVVASFLIALVAPAARAADVQVHIVNGAPNPADAEVDDGDTVTFVNDDDVSHSIFASGAQRGATIPPHGVGGPYGPFVTGGQQGNFAYQIDPGGAPGTITVRGPVTTTTTTTIPRTTSTSPFATTAPPATEPETTAPAPTATLSPVSNSGNVVVVQTSTADDRSNRLAVLGVVLLVAGIVGMILVAGSHRRRNRPD